MKKIKTECSTLCNLLIDKINSDSDSNSNSNSNSNPTKKELSDGVAKTTEWKKKILELNEKFNIEQEKIANDKSNKIILKKESNTKPITKKQEPEPEQEKVKKEQEKKPETQQLQKKQGLIQ